MNKAQTDIELEKQQIDTLLAIGEELLDLRKKSSFSAQPIVFDFIDFTLLSRLKSWKKFQSDRKYCVSKKEAATIIRWLERKTHRTEYEDSLYSFFVLAAALLNNCNG